jgi:hypothetical protein
MLDIRKTKIRVKDEKESIKIQNRLFKLKCHWKNSNDSMQQEPEYTYKKFLYIDGECTILHGDNEDFFIGDDYKEITLKDLFKISTFKELLE